MDKTALKAPNFGSRGNAMIDMRQLVVYHSITIYRSVNENRSGDNP